MCDVLLYTTCFISYNMLTPLVKSVDEMILSSRILLRNLSVSNQVRWSFPELKDIQRIYILMAPYWLIVIYMVYTAHVLFKVAVYVVFLVLNLLQNSIKRNNIHDVIITFVLFVLCVNCCMSWDCRKRDFWWHSDFLNKKYRSVLPTGVIWEMCLLSFTLVWVW